MKVLFIAGHGGVIDGVYQTAGKRSPKWPDGRQLFEGEFNRAVVNKLMSLCVYHGISCTDIVPELQDIALPERVKRVNAEFSKDKNVYLVEIHANAGGGTGMEVFTTRGQNKSDILAEEMIDSMERTLRPFKLRADTSDGDRDKEANFAVINGVRCPAMLVECAFMDTFEPDCRMMLEDPDQFVRAIFNGIINIHKKHKL